MIDERQEELASLHALDLLEGSERDQFLAEMEGSSDLRQRVSQLRAAATSLAHAAPEAVPPASLKARVLASAAARESGAATAEVIRFPSWAPWLVAACLAVAVAWAERQYGAAKAAYATLSEQHRVAELALEQTRSQLDDAKRLITESSRQVAELSTRLKDEGDLAHFKIATLASMLGNSPAAVAVAVWDPARAQGVLAVSKLPALASEKDYQLWVIDKQYPSPVSAGVFVVDPVSGEAHIVFRADKPVGTIAKFAVSLERKGGSPSPEGPIVLVSE
jgi:anti-sigma-K factor RskA